VLLIVTLFASIYLGISYILGHVLRIICINNGVTNTTTAAQYIFDNIVLGQVLISVIFVAICAIKKIFRMTKNLHLRVLIRKRLYDFDVNDYSKDELILNLRERLDDVVVPSKYIDAINNTKLEDIERRYDFRFKASDDPECEIFKKV